MNSIFTESVLESMKTSRLKKKNYADLKSRHAGSKRVQPAAVGILCGNG